MDDGARLEVTVTQTGWGQSFVAAQAKNPPNR